MLELDLLFHKQEKDRLTNFDKLLKKNIISKRIEFFFYFFIVNIWSWHPIWRNFSALNFMWLLLFCFVLFVCCFSFSQFFFIAIICYSFLSLVCGNCFLILKNFTKSFYLAAEERVCVVCFSLISFLFDFISYDCCCCYCYCYFCCCSCLYP